MSFQQQPSMNIPYTFEVRDASGRHAGTFAAAAFKDAEALTAALREREPEAGWDWQAVR